MLKMLMHTLAGDLAVEENSKVLVAVSGGVDSMVLLDLLIQAAPHRNLRVSAFHLDHMLRGDAALQDAALVKAFCQAHGIQLHTYRRPVSAIADRNRTGFEVTARELRYSLLSTLVKIEGYTHIATAHHLGDNVETLFLHLFRGSGLTGLTGIKPKSGILIRPLLNVSKSDLYAYAGQHHIPFHEDATNTSSDYARNYIRNVLMPAVDTYFGPQAQDNMASTISLLNEDASFIDGIAQGEWRRGNVIQAEGPYHILDRSAFSKLHVAIQSRLIKMIFQTLNGHALDLSRVHIENLRNWFIQGNVGTHQRLFGLFFESRQDAIRIVPQKIRDKGLEKPAVFLKLGEQHLPQWGIRIIVERQSAQKSEILSPSSIYAYWFPFQEDETPNLWLRQRQAGDVIQLSGMQGKKNVKKLLSELKISSDQKANVPIIGLENEVLWLVGYRKGVKSSAQANSDQKPLHSGVQIRVFPL